MNHEIGGIGRLGSHAPKPGTPGPRGAASPQNRSLAPRDRVDIGRDSAVTLRQAVMIVAERSMEQVRQGIGASREALQLTMDKPLDPVADAATDRVMGFALEGFEQFQRAEHKDMDAAGTRQAYASVIGPAMREGIAEAERILTALNAMNANVRTFISDVSQALDRRIADFVKNGDGA